MLGRSIKAFY